MENINLSLLFQGTPLENLEPKQREYLKEEFEKLQQAHPVKQGEILINTTGINYRDNLIIVSFFIRNATEQGLTLSNLPVKVQLKEESLTEAFQLTEPLAIGALSAGAYKIQVDKNQYGKEIVYVTLDAKLQVRYE